jgi:hypothetical protein
MSELMSEPQDDIREEGEDGEKRTAEAHEIAHVQKKRVCNAEMRGCKGKKSSACKRNGYASRKCEIARARDRPYAKETGMQREEMG